MKKITLIIFMYVFSVGCTSLKYSEIVSLKNNHNSINKTNSITISNKNFHPLRHILRKLKNSISNNYIVIFSWVNHLPRVGVNEFQCLVYDYEAKTTYYIKNEEQNIDSFEISRIDDKSFKNEKFIMVNYLLGNLEVLSNYKTKFSSVEFGTDYNFIDLKTKKVFLFENINE